MRGIYPIGMLWKGGRGGGGAVSGGTVMFRASGLARTPAPREGVRTGAYSGREAASGRPRANERPSGPGVPSWRREDGPPAAPPPAAPRQTLDVRPICPHPTPHAPAGRRLDHQRPDHGLARARPRPTVTLHTAAHAGEVRQTGGRRPTDHPAGVCGRLRPPSGSLGPPEPSGAPGSGSIHPLLRPDPARSGPPEPPSGV